MSDLKQEQALAWERDRVGTDSGKRLFAYQRVIVNAINCGHLCLHKMNRNPSSNHPSGVLISVILAVPGCRVRVGAGSFTG